MRNIININENWKFIRENAGLPAAYPADWTDVTLPHTWNAVDGNDGNGSYTCLTNLSFWSIGSLSSLNALPISLA